MSANPEQLNNAETSTPLQLYAAYPFETDEAYQQGLTSIVAGGALDGNPPDIQQEILRRTRVFYFNRTTGNSITMDEAREYEQSLGATLPANTSSAAPSAPASAPSGSVADETRSLTFAELQELIETGKVDQIPNNKVIPDVLNDAPPSESTASARKKPWEMAVATTTE